MLKKFLFSIIILGLYSNAFSQLKKNIEYSGFFDSYYWRGPISIIGEFGTSFYSGDLCGSLDCQNFKPSFGGGLAYKVWPRVQFGAEYTYLVLSSNDHSPDRNYTFTSKNHEISLFGKFYFIEDIVRRHQDLLKPPKLIKPFVKLGFGAIIIKPETFDLDTDSNITEDYSSLNYQIPFAFGIQFDLSKRFAIITELDMRYTFTDQLDGFSNSSTSGSNLSDMYGGIFLKLQYSPFAPRVRKKKHKLSPPTNDSKESEGSAPASSGRPDGGSSATPDNSGGSVDDLTPSNNEETIEKIEETTEEEIEEYIEEEEYEEESYEDEYEEDYEYEEEDDSYDEEYSPD